MTTTHSHKKHPANGTSKKQLGIIGNILIVPPLLLAIKWFGTSDTLSPEGRVNAFLYGFPESLQHFQIIIVFSLLCCIVSLVLVFKSFNQPAISFRVFDIIAAMLASIIALLNVFQLL